MYRTILLIAVLLASPLSARAVPLAITESCTSGTCALGISGLEVSNSLYDVTFVAGTFDDLTTVYADFPTFWGKSADAEVAAGLIADVLSNASVNGVKIDTMIYAAVAVPYQVSGASASGIDAYVSFLDGNTFSFELNRGALQPFALFSPAASVPEPTTLSLLCAGLFGMGLFRRRTRRH